MMIASVVSIGDRQLFAENTDSKIFCVCKLLYY